MARSNKVWSSGYSQRKGANIGNSKTCVFVAGERPYGDNPWCGSPALEGSSYCEHHHQLCYIPIKKDAQRDFNRHAEYLAKKDR